MRREGDSNPRYALGVYTLSRRASSTTRASLLLHSFIKKRLYFHIFFRARRVFSYKCILFIRLPHLSFHLNFAKGQKLIYFKGFKHFFTLFYSFSNTFFAFFVVTSATSSTSRPYTEATCANVYLTNALSFLLPR